MAEQISGSFARGGFHAQRVPFASPGYGRVDETARPEMLQAAAQRLNRPSSPALSPAAAAAPALTPPPDRNSEQRSARRLSRISPTEFDSVLVNTDTVRVRSREPAQAAAEAIEVTSPTSSSRDLAQQDPSADDASTAPVFTEMATGDGRAANSNAADSAAPPYSATAGSRDDDNARSRLPTAEGTARRGSDTAHYDSLVAVGAIDSPRGSRSRHGSAAPVESAPVVTVRFPPPDAVAGRPNLASPTSQSNTSSTTLAGAFGFSPRKPRVQTGETVQQDKVMPTTPEMDQEDKTLTSWAAISPRGDLPEQCGEQVVSSAGLALRRQNWTHRK